MTVFNILVILAVIIAVLLILIVVVQNSKGGGLASQFAASNSVMGVKKTTDFLEKATWTLVALVVLLSIASTAFIPKTTTQDGVDQAVTAQTTQTTTPAAPAAPAAE